MKTISLPLLLTASLNAIAASLPTGGQFIGNNTGSIDSIGHMMSVTSDKTNNIIKWDSYNVGNGYKMLYDGNNYLNLVKGGSPSIIQGTISAPGKVIIVNPNGISVESGATIKAQKLGLSTARISDEAIDNFAKTGNITLTGKGMGKVTLLGSVTTNNLIIDAGQIIIKDTSKIIDYNGQTLSNATGQVPDNSAVQLKSSTGRIDIGGSKSFDIEKNYNLKKTDFVDHRDQSAISTRDEFLNIDRNLTGSYWLTNDIDLGTINESIGYNKAFEGQLDGAFNHISYSINYDGKNPANAGLFAALNGAEISNLMIDNASLSISNSAADISAGALAGTIEKSKLENIVIKSFDLTLNSNTGTIYTGALAGTLLGSTPSAFKNVEAKFARIDSIDSDKTVYGSMLGRASALAQTDGLNVAVSAQHMAVIGENRAGLTIADNYKSAIDTALKHDASDFGKNFVTHNDTAYNTGFLMPFFIYDYTTDYDGKTHSYSSFIKDKYKWFDLNSFASLGNDKDFINAGRYDISFTPVKDQSLYFINEKGEKAYTGTGSLTINKVHLGNIVINSHTIKEGDSLPSFSITNADSLNFVNNENFNSLNVEFEVADYDGKSGTYKINLKENGANNYTFDVTAGTLEVEKKQEIIPALPLNPSVPKPQKPDSNQDIIPALPLNPSVPKPQKPDSNEDIIPALPLNPSVPKPQKPDSNEDIIPALPLNPSVPKPQKPDSKPELKPDNNDSSKWPEGGSGSLDLHKYHSMMHKVSSTCAFCTGRHSLFTERKNGNMRMSTIMYDIRDMSLAQNHSSPASFIDNIVDTFDTKGSVMTASNSADKKEMDI